MAATDLESATASLISSVDIISDVVNGDSTKEVVTPSGDIPSLRKALADNLYFQNPVPWSNGDNETNFNQLRTFTDGTVWWSPSATNINPVPMGVTPVGDSNWYPWQDRNLKNNILEEVTRFKIKGTFSAGFTYETVDDVGLDNSGNPWSYKGSLPFTVVAGTVPSSPDYKEEGFSNIDAITELRGELDDRVVYLTLPEAQAKSDIVIGQRIRLTDHSNGLYIAVSTADTGGYYKPLPATNLKLSLDLNEQTVVDHFDSVVTNATVNSAATFLNTLKFSQGKVYNLDNITLPDYVSIEAHSSTIFKKSSDGFIFDLGRLGVIKGCPTFDGSFGDLNYTGNSIIISRGDNSTNKQLQGHQIIFGCSFKNSASFHVRYSEPNKGWMSKLLYCKFLDLPANSVANVLWPDEPTNGGNRQIIGGYSAGPVCNVKGADNGLIFGVEIGSVAEGLSNQGVYFDPTSVNTAKKIRIVGNRFAIANGSLDIVKCASSIFEGNITAGSVKFGMGAVNCKFDSTNIQSSIVDESVQENVIDIQSPQFFTPTIKAGLTLGNGTLSGEFSREGYYVDFRIELDVGSTTSITGSMIFDLPVPIVTGGTRVFLGDAWYSGFIGTSYIQQNNGTVRVYDTINQPAVWNATVPKAFTAGDKVIIQGRYRI